jgi:hypothetical protein
MDELGFIHASGNIDNNALHYKKYLNDTYSFNKCSQAWQMTLVLCKTYFMVKNNHQLYHVLNKYTLDKFNIQNSYKNCDTTLTKQPGYVIFKYSMNEKLLWQ